MDIYGCITGYLDAQRLSWAPSTLKSERSRLLSVAKDLNGDADHLWKSLNQKGLKSYTLSTIWIRVCAFYDWQIDNALFLNSNPYSSFKVRNKRLFKNCYEKRLPDIDYASANERIQQFSDAEVREVARLILQTGMRVSEAFSFKGNSVVGKGSKKRTVYIPGDQKRVYPKQVYSRLYRQLKLAGLTPHMLRKICLSRLVELGASPFELTEIAGWASVNTASSYIKVNESRLKDLMKQVQS